MRSGIFCRIISSVFLKLAEIYYNEMQVDDVLETSLILKRLFNVSASYNENLISPDDSLELLTPILCAMPLHVSIVGALRLLGWPYEAIAKLCNAVFAAFPEKIQEMLTIPEAHKLLSGLRKEFSSRMISLDDNHSWLCKIINSESDISNESSTIISLRKIICVEEDVRYARINDKADYYAWLRDRWSIAKKDISKKLQIEDFYLKSKDMVKYGS